MADGVSLLSLLRPLAAVVLAVAPTVRKLHAERRAGRAPFSMKPGQDRLDEHLDDALQRLGAINDHDEWWQKLLAGISAKYTRPDFFKVISVREWLGDAQVKSSLIALARTRLIGGELDAETFVLVREKYTEATGEAEYRATYAIAVVLAVLQASAQGVLSEAEAVIHGGMKDGFSASAQRDEKLQASIDALPEKLTSHSVQEDPLHGKHIQDELRKICSRRGIPGVKSAVEIEALIARIENGELGRAPRSDQAEAYYWAARILAPDADKAAQAIHYLERYQGFPTAAPDNVSYVNGWLTKAEGHTQDAINAFSDINTADARTSILAIVAERDGNAAALEWLADHIPYDHTLLNPVGWRNAVGMMAEEGRWQQGLDTLDAIQADIKDAFPDLLFVEGVLHAGFLLPEPIRGRLLKETNIDFNGEVQEGQIASNHRQAAVVALERARDRMLHLDAEKRAHGCEYHLTWIQLTDPALHQAGLDALAEKMKDGEYAAFMLDIALNFDVPFDREPLERYLRRRIREGRDAPQDRAAQLRLIQHFGTPGEVLAYLEQEETKLAEVLTPQTLAAVKLHALVADERVADAEKELDQCTDIFSSDELERFRLMFSDHKGEELKGLESLYDKTGEFEDLQNLVRYLERTKQWASLIPHAQTLLKTRRSAGALRTLIHAMQNDGAANDDIAACLDDYGELIAPNTPEGDDLQLSQGWALFSLGKFPDAQQIANELAERTHAPNAVALEINIALRSGQWEHFAAIIDREYDRLQEFPPRLLLQMSSVIADIDQDRAVEILRIAADNEPEDGSIQANAYWIASQIGRENDASTWLKRATDLSQRGEGPLQSITLREMADMMPARAEQRSEWERQFSTGEIGIHPIASLLNVPIAQVLVGQALTNENEHDPRQRSVIPVRHGGRALINLEGLNKLAFDLTSLLILENLEVLDAVFLSFEHIYLSPRLMDILFQEHRQVRFHQPSLVAEAQRIREIIANGDVQLLQTARAPKDLAEEVGDEMASLLHAAQESGGRVVSTLPVPKAGSLDHDEANLGAHAPLVLKSTQLILHLEKQIAPNAFAKAEAFLSSVDRGESTGTDELGDGPLYVDNLALRYLDTAGVLQHLRHLGRSIFVDPVVDADAKALIEGARHGDQVASVIDRLRKRIRDGVAAGKVIFLPESSDREDHDEFHQTNALMDIFSSIGNAGAVCIDDRAIGKHANISDKTGQTVPMINSIDVLEHLSAQSAITAEQKDSCDFRLLKGGFAFLPFSLEQVRAALMASHDADHGNFAENRDLLAIRENLMRIRSLKLLRLPEEVFWFSQLAQITKQLLAQIWEDQAIALNIAETMSDWIIEAISPLPTSWQESIVLAREESIEEATKFTLLQLINIGLTLTARERRDAYANWTDQRLIQPLLPANSNLVDEIAEFMAPLIAKYAKEIADELA